MRHYETTYILRPNLGEEQQNEILERTAAIVSTDNGTIIHADRWGLRKLAYQVGKETQGYYVCVNYAANGAAVAELERIFRIDDRILRYLTVKLADFMDEAAITAEREKIEQAKAKKNIEAESSVEKTDEEADE